MTTTGIFRRIQAALHSIRWRLPLSYAAIALLTAAALGSLLLVTLDDYYSRQERAYLREAGSSMIRQVEVMVQDELTDTQMSHGVHWLSFLTQTRVQILDTDRQVMLDSGPVEEQTQVSMDFPKLQGTGIPPGEQDNTGPYLSFSGEAEMMVVDDSSPNSALRLGAESEGEGLRYPIRIQRGPFGQLISESASPTGHSSEQFTVPIFGRSGTELGYLVLSEGPAFGNEIVGDVAEKGIVAAGFALVIAVLAGIVISRNISQPLMTLSDATARMAHGDFAVSVPLQRRDEFGQLARAFETMARRVETTINTLKQFVADAAHEINTPLTALRTNLELTADSNMPAAARDDIQQALAELTRLEHLTHSLLVLARLETPDRARTRQRVDLSALIRQMVERYASRADQAGIGLESAVPSAPVYVMGDRHQLVRVFDNLLDNALKFTPAHGNIHLAIRREPGQVHIAVRDTGIGIPDDDMSQLFSRFHRGRNAAAFPGNGLGLVITKSIVTDHGGQIGVESGSTGTCFTVTLPDVRDEEGD